MLNMRKRELKSRLHPDKLRIKLIPPRFRLKSLLSLFRLIFPSRSCVLSSSRLDRAERSGFELVQQDFELG